MANYTVIGHYDTGECSFNNEVEADSWQDAAKQQIKRYGVTVVAVIEGSVDCADNLDFKTGDPDDDQLKEG